MKSINLSWITASLALVGCGGPVPADMFLTMSVSTRDVAVETSINGKADEFLSGDSGSMTGSRPINKLVSEGENEATFVLTPIAAPGGEALDPALLATLEISAKGDIVDTLAPGERTIFSRELSSEEAAALAAGDTVIIMERFSVEKAALEAIKRNTNH